MASYRQFILTNESRSESINLNEFNGYLATSPTGLGIYRQNEYIVVGNQRIQTVNKQAFQKITLNVLILGNRNTWESKYASLRDFISKNIKQGFRLYYTPDTTRYIKCDITMADKTEKDMGNLPVKLDIQPTSLWLDDVQVQTVKQEVVDENMFQFVKNDDLSDEYDRSWYSANFEETNLTIDGNDVYSIVFSSVASQIQTLNNTGTETTPLIIRIFGKAINPYITLKPYGSDEVSQTVAFRNLTINDGYYLEISSNPSDTHIELVNMATGQRFDRESFADIDTNMYLELPVGRWDIQMVEESTEQQGYAQIIFANQNYGG